MNTHRAVIESSVPPMLNLIAAGPSAEFCQFHLDVWLENHPLGEFDTALILEVKEG